MFETLYGLQLFRPYVTQYSNMPLTISKPLVFPLFWTIMYIQPTGLETVRHARAAVLLLSVNGTR